MQREKLHNLHKTAFFIAVLIAFKMIKNLKGYILTVRKRYFLIQDKFVFSYFILLQLFCVNCRAFHAASCGIFCFLEKKIFS